MEKEPMEGMQTDNFDPETQQKTPLSAVKLPDECNYIEAYLTLRCPLRCSYCINNESGRAHVAREELAVEQWADGLNRIDFGNVPLTLGGGEPTQYRSFYALLDQLRPDIHIDLLTNLQFDIDEFIRKTSPDRFNTPEIPCYKSIRVSYHAETMDAADLLQRACRLQEAGFCIGIFGLNHPLNIRKNMEMAEMACNKKMFFFIKDYLGHYQNKMFGFYNYKGAFDGVLKTVKCRTRELLIGPEGSVYRCHRDLYIGDTANAVGHINRPDLRLAYTFRTCTNFGTCNPCDVKIKTNRFLQMGHCSVEIEPNNG